MKQDSPYQHYLWTFQTTHTIIDHRRNLFNMVDKTLSLEDRLIPAACIHRDQDCVNQLERGMSNRR
jgi:hypothetical protein